LWRLAFKSSTTITHILSWSWIFIINNFSCNERKKFLIFYYCYLLSYSWKTKQPKKISFAFLIQKRLTDLTNLIVKNPPKELNRWKECEKIFPILFLTLMREKSTETIKGLGVWFLWYHELLQQIQVHLFLCLFFLLKIITLSIFIGSKESKLRINFLDFCINFLLWGILWKCFKKLHKLSKPICIIKFFCRIRTRYIWIHFKTS